MTAAMAVRSIRRMTATLFLALAVGPLGGLHVVLGSDAAGERISPSDHPVEQALGAVAGAEGGTLRVAGTAEVDGLRMYYEVHGDGEPVVLLHGAYAGIDVAFSQLLPTLAADRKVVAIEQQGHGHTPDADRPLSYERMADDTAAVLHHLGIERADFFGYSMGANIALQVAIRHPRLVRKIAVASAYFDPSGLHAGVLEGIAATTPQVFEGSGLEEAYAAVAPDPAAWPTLIEKVKQLDLSFTGWAPVSIASIDAPTLIILGDSDIVDPAHAVRMFQLLGGAVPGDFAGQPDSRLAVLPGTTHIGVLADRAGVVADMVREFLDAPVAVAGR